MSVAGPGATRGAQIPMADPIGPDEADALFTGLRSARRLLVAVSGGADSMALLHLLSAWQKRWPAATPDLLSVTIDHGLRPESAAEAAWVADHAATLGLPHQTLCWTGPKPAAGLQEAAREARYRLLAGASRREHCDAIVLAHTQDDQAETLVMRLARGSGVDGLAAMPARRVLTGTLLLLRPLLDMPKVRLTATLQALGQSWCEDPSNANERFERVRVRAAQVHRDALGLSSAHLAQSAHRLGRARLALEQWTNDVVRRHVDLYAGAGGRLAETEFRQLPDEIALRVLQRLLWAFGGQDRPPRLVQLETLLADLRSGRTGATLGGCEITRTALHLFVTRETGRQGLPAIPLPPGPPVAWDQRFTLALASQGANVFPEECPPAPLMIRPFDEHAWRHLQSRADAESSRDTSAGLQFALSALKTTLCDLPWRARLTLPSIWDGPCLVAVPYLGTRYPLVTQALPWQDRCYQEFSGAERLWNAAIG